MAHMFAMALQQAGGIGQFCTVEEPDVYVRRECVDIAERSISEARNGTAVMHKLSDLVPARSHYIEPLTRDGTQFA